MEVELISMGDQFAVSGVMWVGSVKEEVAELGRSQEEGVSFGRANIKGKLGKRLTQNLESHHSSDFRSL